MGSRQLLDEMERSGESELVGGIHNGLFFDSFWPNPRLDRLPWIGEDPKHRFRLPDRLSLSKIRLKPNQIAGVGQWPSEYVIPKGVRTLLEEARFSGIEFRTILDTRTGGPLEDYFQLFSDRVLGLRELDDASPEMRSPHPEEQGYDALGCLCYDARTLEAALDSNRTGEHLVSFEFPEWIVRSSVRDWFRRHSLRGWAFEPVLELGTRSYEEYCELWASLYRLLDECGGHTIRGRRLGAA